MAYLREEKENLEVSYPIKILWDKIPKALEKLKWTTEEKEEAKFHLTVKTKGAFLSYSSTMMIDLIVVDKNTTKMSIAAETPVTTITSIADYGRTRERIDMFVTTLAKLMETPKKNASQNQST
ncbi:MAG TPA: hypothetical protein DGG95_05675 [Cytophagales bacterium]|nr:hypothetical protein [Cytophagales bacterium]